MSEALWNDLIDWLATTYEAKLDHVAYPADNLAIRHVYTRLIYDPNDWSQQRDAWQPPFIQIYGVSANPSGVEHMRLAGPGEQNTAQILTINYPIYVIGVVEGGIDDVGPQARILAKRMMEVARQLDYLLGQELADPDDHGEKTTGVQVGDQTIDNWRKAGQALEYFATIVQPLRIETKAGA